MKKFLFTILLSLGLVFLMTSRVAAASFIVGNTAEDRPSLDSRSDFTIIDTNNPASKDGFITSFNYYSSNTNPFRFVVVDETFKVKWVSEEIESLMPGPSQFIPTSHPNIEENWNVGLYFADSGAVPFQYDNIANIAYYTFGNDGVPVIGETLSFNGGSRRIYSFLANAYERKAYINTPEQGQEVIGDLILDAYLIDNRENDIQWAVRKGTCAAGTNTVLGNVDGYSETLDMEDDAVNYKYTYTGEFDVSEFDGGMYCFIFNPVEDEREEDIRLTREFFINSDSDGDGVLYLDDRCPGTGADNPSVELGTNRWMYDGEEWITEEPNGRGPKFEPSMDYTYGCSCEQILDEINEATGEELLGHYKFGCSKSILEDWNAGEYYMGETYIETVQVPSTGEIVSSANILDSDTLYFLKASGKYSFANWSNYGIADAEWAYRSSSYLPTDPNYTDIVEDEFGGGWVKGEGYYNYDCGLDVQVNGTCVDWGDFNEDHDYQLDFYGEGNKVDFYIYDNAYSDNSGKITMEIWEDKWVNLW